MGESGIEYTFNDIAYLTTCFRCHNPCKFPRNGTSYIDRHVIWIDAPTSEMYESGMRLCAVVDDRATFSSIGSLRCPNSGKDPDGIELTRAPSDESDIGLYVTRSSILARLPHPPPVSGVPTGMQRDAFMLDHRYCFTRLILILYSLKTQRWYLPDHVTF